MVTPLESKAQLTLLADDAADTIRFALRRSSGSFESRRSQLLEVGQDVVGYYSEGSAALAADFYDEARADARVAGRFVTETVVLDRVVKIRRSIAWAASPLETGDEDAAVGRLAEVVRSEVTRPYRDTILTNRRLDPASVGWKRITSGSACGFCKLLAAKGAVYRQKTALFAAHDNCACTAAPVFTGGEAGPEASVIQYIASKRRRTPAEKAAVREWVHFYEDRD